jgi:hypothetical protein
MRMEPPVSVPVAAMHSPAASAAPDPPLEPPGIRSRSQGLRVGGVHVFIANSCVLAFPTMIAPAPLSRSTTAASWSGTKFARIFEPAVVFTPRV